LKIFNKNKSQLFIIIIIGIFIFSLTGLGALKRMVLIKGHQKILGQKTGFIVALLLDILWGTFSHSPLSFAYSFLFLGLIYFGKKMLFLWFFFAQIIIAFFSGASLSPLMLFLSPTLNLAFAFAMPLLLILAIPLWDWQLNTGLLIISGLQTMVKWSGTLISFFPRWEIHGGILVCLLLFYFSRRRALALALLLLTQNLNVDQERFPSSDRFEYVPKGHPAKIIHKEKETVVYFKQGKCRMRLIRGQWWEKCSPPRRSTKIKS
jgi:competence protein ComEC